MKHIELVDQLSPRQKTAYIRTQRLVEKGLNMATAAKKANVKISDYNNARVRIQQLLEAKDKFRVLTYDTISSLTVTDAKRFLSMIEKAVTTFKRKIGV